MPTRRSWEIECKNNVISMTGTNVVNPELDLAGSDTSFLKVGGSGSSLNRTRDFFSFLKVGGSGSRPSQTRDFFSES
jgi:hypothetical protein